MTNCGLVLPDPGYLAGAEGHLSPRTARFLAFDEVKTGLHVAWGGAVEAFGVVPDLVCLAKAIGGGPAVRRDRRHRGGMGMVIAASWIKSAPSTATRSRWPPRR